MARVIYRGHDNHLHELRLEGGRWIHADLSALSGAREVLGKPYGYFTAPDRTARVIYRGSDDHVYEIWLAAGGVWRAADLTVHAGGPPVNGEPTAYVTAFSNEGEVARVVYRGHDNHLHELRLERGSWIHADLTALSGAREVLGPPRGYFTRRDSTARVVYRGPDDHLWEVWLTPGRPWEAADLTAFSGAPTSSNDPFPYVGQSESGDLQPRVLYRGHDEHVRHLVLDLGTWRHEDIFRSELRVLIKTLFPPTLSVDAQFESMRSLFASVGLIIERGPDENLTARPELEALLDLDIGNCELWPPPFPTTTAEQDRLFRLRRDAGPDDIVVYVVRSTRQGNLGCASHPHGVPGAVVNMNATEFVMAHEVGHVLGLLHVNDTNRLMNPDDGFTNLPPDLSAGEVASMVASGHTRE